MYDYLVVGSGYAGSVIAERLASQRDKKVMILDRRSHIGGNAFDHFDEYDILVHSYGPHIFHTNSKKVWEYLSLFTEWKPYEHRVLADIDGRLVPIPFNFRSIDLLFEAQKATMFKNVLTEQYGIGTNVPILELMKVQNDKLKELANYIYEKVFEGYTTKQWGFNPKQLDASVTSRVPVRVSYDDRYFQDTYQAMPRSGYTAMFNKMLSHPNIEILLNTDYKNILNSIDYGRMIYTGPLDYFFDYKFGRLPYRSLRFEFSHYNVKFHQEVAQVNFPNEYTFTRKTEFKHITHQTSEGTTVATEFPIEHVDGQSEPYYPIPVDDSRKLYNMYIPEVKKLKGKVFFVGRLAEYKYFNMDQIVGRALSVFENELSKL